MRDKIFIIEVGPRDGLQNIPTFIPTEVKAQFIRLLVDTGLKELEVTSFVNPKIIPQLSDASILFSLLPIEENVVYSVLVPTLKELKRAITVGVKKVVFFVAASEAFNRKNLNASISDTLKNFAEMKELCDEKSIKIKASLSTTFYCPFSGYVEPTNVLSLLDALFRMGIDDITLCDTMGIATPKDTEKLISEISKTYSLKNFGLHMHNTYGFALSCIYKAYELGIRKFEASASGLGGCPNAPGATGNIATEVLCNFFEKMGIETGVSLEKLKKAAHYITTFIDQRLYCQK